MSNDESLKLKIEELANKAIFYNKDEDIDFHPMVLLDCVKSVISLDFDKPNYNLINWIEDFLPKKVERNKKSPILKPENASFKELEEILTNKEKDKIEKVLINFDMLSDGTQLMEFFLEMSLFQSGNSFIHIWRSYKIFNFTDIKDKISFYKLMSNFIFKDKFKRSVSFNFNKKVSIDRVNNNLKDLVLYSNLIDCGNANFIRNKNIKNALESMKGQFKNNVALDKSIKISYDDSIKDRKDVLQFINNKTSVVNGNNILLIDSVRALIKDNKLISKSFLDHIYQKLK